MQRFVLRGNQVVAVGVVTGTVLDAAGVPVGTLLNGPVEVPVTASQGVATGPVPSGARPVGSQFQAPPRGFILVQAPQPCGVLHLELGAITLNVLGLVVTTSPIVLDISGDTAGPLGALVCQILATLTSVVNLVGLLNQLLGLLGGLTGGLSV